MAGIRLEDILKEQRKLLAQGDQRAQATIDRLEEIAKTVSDSEKVHKQDRVLQAAQVVEAIKADKDDDRIVEATERGLLSTDGDGLNANVVELIETIKQQTGLLARGEASNESTFQPIAVPQPPISKPAPAQASNQTVDERAKQQGAKYVPTFNERMGYITPERGSGVAGVVQSTVNMIKGALKLENFVDTKETDSGGLFGTEIRRRVEKKKFIEDQLSTGATDNPILAGKRYDKISLERAKLAEINKNVEGMRGRGLTDDQIARSGQFKLAAKSLQTISAVDPLTRERYNPEVATPVSSKPIPKPLADSDTTTEEESETARAVSEQTDLLAKIEENTRSPKTTSGGSERVAPVSGDTPAASGFGLSDLLDFGTKKTKGSAKSILRFGAQAARGLGKLAIPAAAAMAAYDGVTGYGQAAENLDISDREATFGEKLSSAGGSILSGLSFGLLDKKDTSKGIASLFGAGPDISKPVTPAVSQPRMADAVYGKSSENAAASTSAKQTSAPVVVSAPQTTNIQQTQNRLDPGTPRNTESSWRAYNKSKYAF